jgi:FAD/FMN-containing dehydrogenase
MKHEIIAKFAEIMRGPVIGREHPDYDDARKLYNAMIDKRPLFIAKCADVADVMAAVNFGRENRLALAIRGGGHSAPGFASVDDGLVIDLSLMKGVRVDPKNRTVRVGPGCTTGDVDHATQAFGQAVPFGIISTTGVAGLTLSGGHGYLSRQYGLAADNLLEADVVLADGSFVTASEADNPDLLWALRGGGGNFGVVVSFLFRTHPVDGVYGGPIFFEFSDAPIVMKWFRDNQPKLPDEFSMFLGFHIVLPEGPAPKQHWSKKTCLLVVSHTGSLEEAERAVGAMRAALPKPMIDWAQPMRYAALQAMFDQAAPKGNQWYLRGDFVKELSDAAIEAHIAFAAKMPSDYSGVHLYPIDGAVRRQKPDWAAWGHRDVSWSLVIAGIDPDPATVPRLKAWTLAYWQAVHPYNLRGAYANFMMDDEAEARVRAAYGPNYDRLAAVKKRYDPTNLFRVNQNIRPAG